MAKITKRLIDAFGLDPATMTGAVFTTKYPPNGLVILNRDLNPDTVYVGYTTVDETPAPFWTEDVVRRHGRLYEFSSTAARQAKERELKAGGKLVLPVERQQSDTIQFAVAGTKRWADRKAKISGDFLFVPGEAMQARYAAATQEATATEVAITSIEAANRILETYAAWCNGEVYGAIVERWEIDRGSNRIVCAAVDGIWNRIGMDQVRDAMTTFEPFRTDAPSPDHADAAPAP